MRKPENDNPKWQAKRWEHGDYIFAAVTIALMAFFFGAGFGAWASPRRERPKKSCDFGEPSARTISTRRGSATVTTNFLKTKSTSPTRAITGFGNHYKNRTWLMKMK